MPKFKTGDTVIANCKIDNEIPTGKVGIVEWLNSYGTVWINFGDNFRWEVKKEDIDLVVKS